MPRDLEDQLPHFKKIMKGFDANQENREKITTILNGPKPWNRKSDIFLRRQPNLLYNAMMHPLAPYACRGVAWYQGEANANSIPHMLTYKKSLQAWTQRYRKEWQRDDLQFLIVMLPGYAKGAKGGPENPNTNSWAWMRESQLKLHDLPHTAVANTIDLGHLTNIHPTDKLPIGKRLALLASDPKATGPKIKSVDQKNDHLLVHFTRAEGLKTTDGKAPSGFWITDDSKKWVKATAKLDGKSVILHSPKIKKPLYLRYAFSGKPTVNLVNEAGLPAYPFRTDSFKP